MQLLTVDSSNVRAIGYDPVKQVAVVEFQPRKDGRSAYRYSGVSLETVAKILFAHSIGKAVAAELVQSDAPFTRLEPEDLTELTFPKGQPDWYAAVEGTQHFQWEGKALVTAGEIVDAILACDSVARAIDLIQAYCAWAPLGSDNLLFAAEGTPGEQGERLTQLLHAAALSGGNS